MSQENKIYTSTIYREFDILASKINFFLKKINFSLNDFYNQDLTKRLTQKIMLRTTKDYPKYLLKKKSDVNIFISGGLAINCNNGKIKIFTKYALYELFIFLYKNLILFFLIFLSLIKKRTIFDKKISFLIDPGLHMHPTINKNNDLKFSEFCTKGFIKTLNTNKNILVVNLKFTPAINNNNNIIYTSNIYKFIFFNLLDFKSKLYLLYKIFCNTFFYLNVFFKNPLLLILRNDFTYYQIFKFIDNKNFIKSINITNTDKSEQFLWFSGMKNRNFESHMIWYSYADANWPHIYLDENIKERDIIYFPFLKFIRSDFHWVWNSDFKKFLQNHLTNTQIKVVGPILWYLPKNENLFDNTKINIAIFDEIPPKEGFLWGEINSYNNLKNLTSFINDIVFVTEKIQKEFNISIVMHVKSKRDVIDTNNNREVKYSSLRKEISNKKKNFKILKAETNIYSIIHSSITTITLPFSSIPYVSSEIKKEAIYYDPTSNLKNIYIKNQYIKLIFGRNDLYQYLKNLIIK